MAITVGDTNAACKLRQQYVSPVSRKTYVFLTKCFFSGVVIQ